VSVQHRCTVCAKRNIACDVGHLESRFGLFRDSVSVGAR
jgi:hypothetical protein